jgi:hypothetical protein
MKISHRHPPSCRISLTNIILTIVLVFGLIQYYFWSLQTSRGDPLSTSKSPLNIGSSLPTREEILIESAPLSNLRHDTVTVQPEIEVILQDDTFNTSNDLLLPAISNDNSELFLSSLIERSFHSPQLHVTTFLLNTAMALPHKNRMERINSMHYIFEEQWTEVIGKMSRVKYATNGKRVNVTYYCRIYNSMKAKSYLVEGEFVSNTQSLDAHMNTRLDVLRCPLILSNQFQKELSSYISAKDCMGVEILRGKNKVIGQFRIPWIYRRAGYLMSPVYVNSNNDSMLSSELLSGLGAWEGYESVSSTRGGDSHSLAEVFHICVIGLHQLQTDVKLLYRLVEFIEYHILIGVHHMYFVFAFLPDSSTFIALTTALSSYIKDGFVSIASTSENRGFQNTDSVLGIQFHRASIEAFQINSCLYMAKGVADFVGVWNVNEFVVPLPPSHSILSLIQAALVSSRNNPVEQFDTKDENAVKLSCCFLLINSLKKSVASRKSSPEVKISERYSFNNDPVIDDNTIRLIMNTETIFQGGVNSPGACFQPSIDNHNMQHKYEMFNQPDEVLNIEVGKRIHMNYEGYLYTLGSEMMTKISKNQERRTLTFNDDIAKSHFIRTEYKIKERFPHFNEKSFFDVTFDPPGKQKKHWKSYSAIFRPTYEYSEGIKASEMVALSEQEILRQKSRNGYLGFDDSFVRSNAFSGSPPNDLPRFATDFSDIALGAIIERKYKSWDLYLTTFFVHHELFNADKGYGILRIKEEKSHIWKKIAEIFSQTKYSTSGIRRNVGPKHYRCLIRNSMSDAEYEVKGEFMPSKLSADSNANNKLDIFRCKMKRSKECYETLAGSPQHVEVIIINSYHEPIFNFTVPWQTRRTGYLLSTPPAADSFQPWKAYARNTSHLPGVVGGDKLHMSVPGIESPVSQKTLPMYLEFMQHHFLIGVQHMFAAGPYAWGGLMLSNFLMAAQPFIVDNHLTFNSQAGDNINLLNSVLGASLDRDVVKVMYVNMCLYLTKGMVSYLAVWDIDEYFIPQLPHHTIMDVIRAAEAPKPLKPFPSSVDPQSSGSIHSHRGDGRGWADGHDHPFCYLMLSSDIIFSSLGYPEEYDQLKPW